MKTVFDKLNLKDQPEILVLNAPASFAREIKVSRSSCSSSARSIARISQRRRSNDSENVSARSIRPLW